MAVLRFGVQYAQRCAYCTLEYLLMGRAKLRIGVIGIGIYSDAHMRGLAEAHERADVVAICDLNEQRAKKAALRFGASVYTDYKQLIHNPEIDIVLIILPHH